MSHLREVPEWVWNLLDALAAYEDEHPILYRLGSNDTDGALAYERALCFGGFLSERKAWPPREISNAAEFRRAVLRDHAADLTPDPTDDDRMTTASEGAEG